LRSVRERKKRVKDGSSKRGKIEGKKMNTVKVMWPRKKKVGGVGTHSERT